MISPGERFDAFSSNRLIKKEDNAPMLGNNPKFILSPIKHSLFVFIHQLNRSITNIPWLFWIPTIITFIQFEISVLAPLNEHHWESIEEMKKVIHVLEDILRYVPQSAPKIVLNIMFTIYSILVVAHFLLLLTIVSLIRHKKDASILIKIFFFYSYLALPFLRSSIICVISEEVTQIVRESNFGTFFLSLFALIILLLHLFMIGFVQFSMGSSPSPNLINPLAIWGPCAWRSVLFELYISCLIIFLEFTRSIKNQTLFAILSIIVIVLSIPHAIYQSIRTYFISYNAYEYINGLLWSMIFFGIFHIIQCFAPHAIPFWVFIFVWLLIPILGFIIMKIITEYRLKKVRKALDYCSTVAVPIDPKNEQEEFTNMEAPLNSSVFDSLKIKNTTQAVFVARAACLISHSTFTDLSLIRYFIERFPNGLFYFLHLVFLSHGPNQTQFQYVEKLINIYLDSQKKKIGILEFCVFFQIITSIQESSNDIPQSLVRELSKQKLQAMKCQQLLSKFWSSSCKSDITQMSRHAFALSKHVNDLNVSWKLLVMRYPYSLPIVNAYVEYLLSTGTQHRLAETIMSNRPQINEASSSSSSDPDMNISILHQAIEDAVDRRPIISINKLAASLIICIIIALIFLLLPIIVSFILLNRYSNYNEFVRQSVSFESTFSSIPSYFDDIFYLNGSPNQDEVADTDEDILITNNEELEARVNLIKKTEELANSLNKLLKKMPSKILKNSSETVHFLYLHFDLYDTLKNSSYINTVRLASYFTQCLPYIPINDPCVSLVMKNLIVTIEMMEETTIQAILNIQDTVDFYVKYSPIFYVLNWALLIIAMVPLIYFSIKALKDEIAYLLSIYLTIPRSMLIRFAENRTHGSLTNVNPLEQANNSLMMPTPFSNLQATGLDNNGAPIQEDGNNNDNNENNANVADAFKMLMNDHSNVNYSVLPKFFVFKTIFIFCFLCALIAILSTVTCALLVSFSKSLVSCLHTQKVTADRTICSSIIMHGITSLGQDVTPQGITNAINNTGRYHTAILFKDKSFKLSSSALNQKEIIRIQSNDRCSDKSNLSCLSLVSLFDIFQTQVISISNELLVSSGQYTNRSIDYFNSLRKTFNDELYPLLYQTQELVYDFTYNEIRNFRIDIIIIIVVGCFIFIFILIIFMLPTIHEINMTIESVKLPLKYISPLDIADFQKILMYLQGECDFKRGGNNEKSNDSGSGNSILNAMTSPFAIFEDDLSLLFANNTFYALLGTSREASIGLPLSDIFSIVLPFRNDENHPFNNLLNSIAKMQQGEMHGEKVEIKTELEFQEMKSCPIMLKLVPIYKDDQASEKESKSLFDINSKSTGKPSSFVIFIDDLSMKKELEEKIKFEEQSSQKLISSAIPKSLSSLIQKGNNFEPRKFENIPIAMFSIKFNLPEEEFEDELLFACSLFMRTANDINHNFSRSVIKLIHNPPNWFYISNFGSSNDSNNNSNTNSNEDNLINVGAVEDLDSKNSADTQRELIVELSDLLHFVISVIEVFNASSNKDYSLRVIVHVGELIIVPLMLDLPTIEALGTGYQKLKNISISSKVGSVFCTPEVENILQNENIFKFSQFSEGKDSLFMVKIENED